MQRYLLKLYGAEEAEKFNFIGTTFQLPQEYALFKEMFKKNPKSLWIMKPVIRFIKLIVNLEFIVWQIAGSWNILIESIKSNQSMETEYGKCGK
jgi:hypothetical protein